MRRIRMKRILSFLLILVLAVVLVACDRTEDKTTTATTEPAATSKPEESSEPVETTEPEEEDDRLVVRLAHWGLGTVEDNNLWRRRIARFNETNEEIRIEIVEYTANNWNEWLTALAGAKELPDVFLVNNVPDAALSGWARNIKDLVDDEWEDIPVALRDSVTYGEGDNQKIYAVPAAYHYFGYYANITLIGESGSNAAFHTYNYTIDEFFDAVEKVKDVSNKQDGTGTIGLDAASELQNWLPSAYDETGKIQHYLWDGEKFAFTSPALSKAITKANELVNQKMVFSSFSDTPGEEGGPSERELVFGTNGFNDAFQTGRLAFRYGATWDATSYYNNMKGSYTFDFIGLPGKKVIGVSDYFVISKASENPKAAYEVAKYLSFGKKGILDMFDIIEKALSEEDVVLTVNGLPLNEDAEIMNEWFKYYPIDGFKNIYELAAKGEFTVLMEGNKFIPGYSVARWNYDTGIDATISRPDADEGKTLSIGDLIWDAYNGSININDYMDEDLAAKINKELEDALDQILALED